MVFGWSHHHPLRPSAHDGKKVMASSCVFSKPCFPLLAQRGHTFATTYRKQQQQQQQQQSMGKTIDIGEAHPDMK
jgi:hypothetical protein